MAPAALNFQQPHLAPSHQKIRRCLPYPPPRKAWPSSCPEYFSKIRKRVACAMDPHNHRPPDEDNEFRAEISPSVLRSLQPQDSSSKPIPSGESLIERNLRKRAEAQKASSSSSSMEENISVFPLSDDKAIGPSGSSDSQGFSSSRTSRQDLQSSDRGFSPSLEGAEDIASSSPITTAFWQASPPGFDIAEFHNIDYYVYYFRVPLVSYALLFEEPGYLEGVSASSLICLLSPLSIPFLDGREDLMLQWRRDAARKFGKITDNKDALIVATELFSYLWSSKAWADRAASGKATELVMALTYSTYVYILSGAAGDASYLSKKLEECSILLSQSLAQLHGPPLDPTALWEKTLKDAPFALDGQVFVYDHALVFPCKLEGTGGQAQFSPALEDVQRRLNKEFKDSDLIVLLQRSAESSEEYFVLVAPWYWVLTVDSKQFAPIPALLCTLSCLAIPQFSGAGLDFGFAWEQNAVPLGWASIVASLYITNNMRFPALIPFPSLGAIGHFLSDYGMVSSRSSLIMTVLKSSCAPLVVSVLLLVCGWAVWGPSQYRLASVVDFQGYVLVTQDLFSYSGILSKLLQAASVEAIQVDDAAPKLVTSPIALAGLLGLNFTAFTLFPGLRTNGSYLVRSLLKSKQLANQVNLVFTVLLTFILCTKKPFLGLTWLALSMMTDVDCFVKDDVSDTDLVSSLAGIVLVAAAVAVFIPPLL